MRSKLTECKKGTRDYTQKKTTSYIERDERQRETFVETIEALPDDTQIYYADESGFEEYYTRIYGYSASNLRVYGKVYGKKFGRTSVVAA